MNHKGEKLTVSFKLDPNNHLNNRNGIAIDFVKYWLPEKVL